ncbi:MAG: SDR family NAD(P)-dependent oxidoreductase [Ancalomicrobiaceae bacterium]|nr:SDR family NAD(P)-dependent oxidoreductase [Ancalomicrobiaceae bacterium]
MAEHRTDVALIGYSCRLPGAADPEAFWSLIDGGRSAISEVPIERFPRDRYYHPDKAVNGKSYTFKAGIIDDAFGFDPGFFGISPREAVQMDPQQRLMLEVTHEAIERSGLKPSRLAGTGTGVYVGASSWDYSTRFTADPAAIDVQMMTGNTLSIVSNRLSYIFDLRGPSFTVDTACSSSLVALNQAVEAISAGRMDTAIVGGVNLLGSVGPFLGFARASMLSPTGLCRAFDAAGDGYVRAEGAATLVLQSAAKARADGNRIHAVILGSGVNSDGRTVGMSLPSSAAQAALLQAIYARAGIDPDDLAFVEAHGTGTRVGDPAEAGALGRVLGQRRQRPLPIGSVKTNIGHLEPASGLAGVIKAVMALEHERLPASLHFETPNPDIAFAELNLAVAASPIAVPRGVKPRLAGINSFGFGGTNAHVVIAEGDAPADSAAAHGDGHLNAPLVISAQSREALAAQVEAMRQRLAAAQPTEVGALLNAAVYARDRYAHRLVAHAGSRDGLSADLAAWLATGVSERIAEAKTGAKQGTVAFVFSGNGSQWPGMGRAIYAANAAFRRSFDKVDRAFMSRAGWSLLTTMFSAELDQEIERTEVAQPLLFAVQVALTEALAAVGLKPAIVLGHSVGEVAAAWAAGALDLADAVTVIHARSTAQEMTRDLGGMAALLMGAKDAEAALAEAGFPGIEIAAHNSPRGVTISGPTASLDKFLAHARKRRLALKRLDLDYPFHCALVDPIRAPLMEALTGIRPRDARVSFVSTVSGKPVTGHELGPDYWWANVRQPVTFQEGVETAARLGADIYIEIGPRPVLTGYITDTLADAAKPVAVMPGLDRTDTSADDPVRRIVSKALALGADIDETALFGAEIRPPAALPTYRWHNQTYLVASGPEASPLFEPTVHPLIGVATEPGTAVFAQHLDPETLPLLADHRVGGSIVVPAAGLAEMALAGGRAMLGTAALELRDFAIERALLLEAGSPREVSVVVGEEGGEVIVRSRPRIEAAEWTRHARGFVTRRPAEMVDVATAVVPTRTLSGAEIYRLTTSFGLHYGPTFARVTEVAIAAEGSAEAALTPFAEDEARPYLAHPAAIDAGFHALFALLPEATATGGAHTTYLPTRFGSMRISAAGAPIARVRVEVTKLTARSVEARFSYFGPDGSLVARLDKVRFSAVKLAQAADLDDFVYRTVAIGVGGDGSASPVSAIWPTGAAKAAEALGIAATTAGEPSEGRLLTDAAVTYAAVQAIAQVVGERQGGFSVERLIADGRIAADSGPLILRLLRLIAEDGFAEETNGLWRLDHTEAAQPIDLMVRTILADHPDFAAEATLISRLASELPRRLKAPSDQPIASEATLEHFACSSPTLAGLGRAIRILAADFAGKGTHAGTARVLVVGADDPRLVADLAATLQASGGTINVSDPEQPLLDRCRLSLAAQAHLAFVPWSHIGDGDRFDLILGADVAARFPEARSALARLAASLAADGALVLAEPAPTGLIELVRGVGPGWWLPSADPDRPVGRIADERRWGELLAATGLPSAEIRPLSDGATAGYLVTVRARPAKPAETPSHVSEVPAIIVADGEGRGRALCDALTAQLNHGRRPVRLLLDAPGNDKPDGAAEHETVIVPLDGMPASDAALAAALPDGPIEVLFAYGAFAREADAQTAALARTSAFAGLCRALKDRPVRIWVIAPGAMRPMARAGEAASALAQQCRPAQAALWGFARVAANELPHLDIRLVDPLPALEAGEIAIRLATLIADPGEERELLVDADGRRAPRIVAGGLTERMRSAVAGPATSRLEIEAQGSLDRLRWHEVARKRPGPGEIEVKVTATGLNFRDVMWAMGLLPAEALEDGFAGATLGMECSGTVTAIGSEVEGFRVGDRCVAFAAAAFAGHVTVPAHAAAQLPASIPLEAAATIPVAFLTAWYALIHLARIEPGETVLIHGGAGGVGLAALQIAKTRGARVIASAGSTEKRGLVSLLGADHVIDSRSLGFADEVMRLTGGDGVDVVLNSLAGEAMERSLACLRPFGRFLELGKRDFYGNTRLGLRPFRQNLSYFGIDADQLLTRQLPLAKRLLAELLGHFDDGTLTALPYRAFDSGDATAAFRLMQQAGHIGKIVIRAPEDCEPADAVASGVTISADARYLIVGGTGGFGLALARRLARRGARHLVLASRRGRIEPENAATLAEIEALGAHVEVVALDAADEPAVVRLMQRLAASGPALKGVFLTAMVLDDGLIAGLDPERIGRVLRPKIAAAAILDRATRPFALDCFVLYSSATTLVGNPGQANYVAANAYLEALAVKRRLEGLPALAVAWGAISDAGYLARNTQVGDVLARRLGKSSLAAEDALDGLEAMLTLDQRDPALATIGFARIDWGQARRELALVSTPLYAALGDRLDAPADVGSDGALADELQHLDHAAALDRVGRLIALEIERILRIPVEEIDRRRPLSEIGMDSLMALELRMAAEDRLGVEIPLMSLAGGASLDDIAERALARLAHGATGEPALDDEAAAIAKSHLGEVSDADLARLTQAAEQVAGTDKRVFR